MYNAITKKLFFTAILAASVIINCSCGGQSSTPGSSSSSSSLSSSQLASSTSSVVNTSSSSAISSNSSSAENSSSSTSSANSSATSSSAANPFIVRVNDQLMLNGKVFRFQGSNNYYMHYKSKAMVDAVLSDAVAMNVSVLRIWGFIDGGDSDNVQMQPSLGVYEPTGSAKSAFDQLDYTIKRAGELGVRLVIVFTNNWDAFGGIPQYVKWLNLSSHDEFFTNSDAKTAYKNYMSHMLNRVNSLTGVTYKDDPTIMTWELVNEPRVESDKTGKVLVEWTKEMSNYVKSLDTKHLVALGDEGFFKRDSTSWAYNGYSGVDWEAILNLSNIDYGTIHMYPGDWGFKDQIESWGTQWIKDHISAAKTIGKPAVLEEYGTTVSSKENREFVYARWTDAVYDNGGTGSMFWTLTSIDDGSSADQNGLYPDYDGYRILNDSGKVAALLKQHGAMMRGEQIARANKLFITSPAKGASVHGTVTVKTFPLIYDTANFLATLQIADGTALSLTDADADGYYTADWDTTGAPEDSTVSLQASLTLGEQKISDSIAVTVSNSFGWQEIKAYTFDTDLNGWAKDGEWLASWSTVPVAQTMQLGNGALAISGTYPGSDSWEELRVVGPVFADLNSAQKITFELYYPVAAYDANSSLDQQIRPYMVLNPGWTKIGVDSMTGKLNTYPVVTLNGADYFKINFEAEWEKLDGKSEVHIGVVNNKLHYTGPIYLDNVRLYKKI